MCCSTISANKRGYLLTDYEGNNAALDMMVWRQSQLLVSWSTPQTRPWNLFAENQVYRFFKWKNKNKTLQRKLWLWVLCVNEYKIER